jgi:hypothetical protein
MDNMPANSWSDEPLRETDLPGRPQFAQVVAARINAFELGAPSTVFGLVGPWGCGKTTLLTEIAGKLDDGWTCIHFTPWSATDEGSLALEFVNALASGFPNLDRESLRDTIIRYARFGSPLLSLIPAVGTTAEKLTEQTLEALSRSKSWHEEFRVLSERITETHQRVLMLVDDVDRLDAPELRALLRIVRLLGRFDSVHYLLAYDQTSVEEQISAGGPKGRSAAFMEKIVQYPFEVPPLPEVTRRHSLSESIGLFAGKVGVRMADDDLARATELVEALVAGVETPRALRRFREQLLTLAPLAAEAELDPIDFAAITWLRMMHHDVWSMLSSHRDELVGGAAWSSKEDAANDWSRRVRKQVRAGARQAAVDVVGFLFPRVSGASFSWRVTERRVSDRDYFQRYFILAVPDDDVSDRMVTQALDAVASGRDEKLVARLEAILDGDDADRAALGYAKCFRHRSAGQSASLPIVEFLAERLRSRSGDDPMVGSPRVHLERWLPIEIYRALDEGVGTIPKMAGLFGEHELIGYAYPMRRAARDEDRVRALMRPLAEMWKTRLRDASLDELLVVGELPFVVSFLDWALGDAPIRGLLADHITGPSELVKLAGCFVAIERWVGAGVTFDLSFREKEFVTAAGEAIETYIEELSVSPEDDTDFDVTDRESPMVSDAERQSVALRGLIQIRSRRTKSDTVDAGRSDMATMNGG